MQSYHRGSDGFTEQPDSGEGADSRVALSQARLNEASKIMPWDMPDMKFVLGELGLRESYCRPPFVEPSAEKKADLRARVAQYKKA